MPDDWGKSYTDRIDHGEGLRLEPYRIFIAYSRQDEKLRDDLEVHLALLKRHQLATIFHDRRIVPGQHWETEIDSQLLESDVILLLLSPDFLASDYCYGVEMQTALELDGQGQAVVIPIVLRPCEWKQEPALSGLQALPKDGTAVTTWTNRDEALVDVASGVRKVILGMAPKPIPTDLTLDWSPTAMVVARLNRIIKCRPLPRVPSSVILVLPDQVLMNDSFIIAVAVTDSLGRPAARLPMRVKLSGASWGTAAGRSRLPSDSPLDTQTDAHGMALFKIFADAKDVSVTVKAAGFPQEVAHFVSG